MRKLFKILLPPFVGFAAFFIAIRYSPHYFTLKLDEIGAGTLRGFMAYYKYFLPLLFVVGVLTQILIIVPVWNNLIHKSAGTKVLSFSILCLLCMGFAIAMAYPMWDSTMGPQHLIRLSLFMAGVQVAYWLMNIVVLYVLSERKVQQPQQEEIESAP